MPVSDFVIDHGPIIFAVLAAVGLACAIVTLALAILVLRDGRDWLRARREAIAEAELDGRVAALPPPDFSADDLAFLHAAGVLPLDELAAARARREALRHARSSGGDA